MSHDRARGFLIQSDAQAKITLKLMQRLVHLAINDHDFVWWSRMQLSRIVPDAITDRDWQRLGEAVRQFVKDRIHFVPDPVGVENITPPTEHQRVLQSGRWVPGDCDDAATLSAAMGMAVGIPAVFTIRAFWKPDSPYQHVLTTLRPRGGRAIVCDTTRDAQKFPPKPTREFSMRV